MNIPPTYLDKGKLTRTVSENEPVAFTFPSGSQMFSPITNLIPTLSSVSGGRVLLSGKSFNQALSLTHREVPLVQSTSHLNEPTFVEKYGEAIASVRAKESGLVNQVTDNHIKVGETIHEIYNNFLSGKKTSLHFTPVVKVGDKVNKGDLLATSNFSDHQGNLALGVNLKTAIMPYYSGNFEDAFVVSESGAKKLQAEQLIPIRVELTRGIATNKDKYISLFANKYVNAQLSSIDSDGVVKKGSVVKIGDPLVLVMEPRTLKTLDVHLGNISKLLKGAYNDRTYTWDYQHDGEVTDVSKTNSLITVTVKTKRDLEVGDKLCCDRNTEIHTSEGWKYINEVKLGDRVESLNPDTNQIEFVDAVGLHAYQHEGRMYSVENENVSMLVTDNHQIYNCQNNYWSLKTAFRLFETEYLLLNKEKEFLVKFDDSQFIEFNGPVYCVTLITNHIMYCRRNGKCHWTGNSNFGGAKGVVGLISSDTNVPQTEDGKPVDLILNTMSVVSRVSPGIPLSMALGKVAQKLGKPLKVTPFIGKSSSDETAKLLAEHHISATETIYNPISGTNAEVFVGPLYTQRLLHTSEDKLSARSEGSSYDLNLQPAKGGDEGAKRIGNLATNALLSHNAKNFLQDIGVVRATRNDEYWRALKLGQPLPTPKVPFVFEKFIGSMQGAGIKVTQRGDEFSLLPQTDKDLLAMSVGPIASPATYKLKNDQLVFEKGGMFDENIVGLLGNQFNHIELHHPVPNPISEDYIRKLLKLTKAEYSDLVASGELEPQLKKMNVDKLYEDYVKKAKVAKKSDKDDVVKVLGFLKNLKNNDIQLKDLMLHNVAVIPAQYRPIAVQGGRVMSTGINELYRDLILNNNAIKTGIDAKVPDEVLNDARKKQYEGVKAIYGLGDPISTRNQQKGFKGILGNMLGIKGGSAKESFYQAKVINKPTDLVGRAVLTPDTKLNLDEASVPSDLLWKLYSPFVIRRLVQRGVPATLAKEYVEKQNPIALQSLQEETLVRPATISRDPQLHKYNQLSFYLKPNAYSHDKTLKLNPLLYKSLNADNDGDQLNVALPASEEARLETIGKMRPSVNLISAANFSPMFTPSNESALGLYQLSSEKSNKVPKEYDSHEDVIKDFKNGKLDISDQIKIKQ